MSDRIVVLGAGGLALGFFGPELRDQYEMTFLDTKAKEDLVAQIQKRRGYVTNLAGEDIQALTVEEVDAFRLDVPEQDAAIREHIAQARIFFTSVGIRNLGRALTYLSERLAGRSEAIYILCAENGENIADRWRAKLPDNIHVCETVMGRMCRIEDHAAPRYGAVTPEIPWGVVGEAFFGMPLSDKNHDPEVFHSGAFQFVPDAEFHARDRVKLYAHNGLHFFIAVQGRIRGVDRFSDLAGEAEVTAAARELLDEEIAPALWKDCTSAIGRAEFDAYIKRLPGRLVSCTLRDQIARGVRGIEDKFGPNERVMGGLRLLLENGIRPRRYYDLLACGLEVARRDVSGEAAEKLFAQLATQEVQREVEARWKKLR